MLFSSTVFQDIMNNYWITSFFVIILVLSISTSNLTFAQSNQTANSSSVFCGYDLWGNLYLVEHGTGDSCNSKGTPTLLSKSKGILSSENIQQLVNRDRQLYILMWLHPINARFWENPDISKMCQYDKNGNFVVSLSDIQKEVLTDLKNNFGMFVCPSTGAPTAPPAPTQTSTGSVRLLGVTPAMPKCQTGEVVMANVCVSTQTVCPSGFGIWAGNICVFSKPSCPSDSVSGNGVCTLFTPKCYVELCVGQTPILSCPLGTDLDGRCVLTSEIQPTPPLRCPDGYGFQKNSNFCVVSSTLPIQTCPFGTVLQGDVCVAANAQPSMPISTENSAFSKTPASKCDNCTHNEMLSKWVSSLPDGAIVPVVILFQGQPSIDDIKSNKKIDYTGDIELIKSYGGNVTKTYDIIHGAAANIPRDKVLPLANDPRIASVDLDYPSCVIPEGCPSSNSTKNNNASENLSVNDVPVIHSKESLSSPLKQIKSGTSAKDVKCNQGLVLLIKKLDNSPVCLKSQTAQKLVERGCGTIIQEGKIHTSNKNQSSPFTSSTYQNATNQTSATMIVLRITGWSNGYGITTVYNVITDVIDKYPQLKTGLLAEDKRVLNFTTWCQTNRNLCINSLQRPYMEPYSVTIPSSVAQAMVNDPMLHFGGSKTTTINVVGITYAISL